MKRGILTVRWVLGSWAAVALLASACRTSSGASDTASSASASASETPEPVPEPSASAAPEMPLELQRFTFASKLRGKEPADVLEAAEPGQRVWAHFSIRNRTGDTKKIIVTFLVNGETRTTLTLKVEPSWSFRTWGYNTLRKTDTEGEVAIEAVDYTGKVLTSAKLPIKPKAVVRKSK
jgi:hypothetical protein